MSIRSCPRCGSTSIRADRSLGGRLICMNCGASVGQGQSTRTNQKFTSPRESTMDMVGHWAWHTANCDCHSIKLTSFIKNKSAIKEYNNQN